MLNRFPRRKRTLMSVQRSVIKLSCMRLTECQLTRRTPCGVFFVLRVTGDGPKAFYHFNISLFQQQQ